MKFINTIIIICFLLCNFQIQAQKVESTKEIHLESFSDFPEESDGCCSCYFSISKNELTNHNYIFYDIDDVAFIKIDGNFIRFELINYKDDIYIYKNKDYTLKLEILKRKFIESELELEKGIITVHTPKGTVKQKFIGECGC
ncbi:MAG: hypothetical protein ACK5M0_04160 [Bacteroidales bacterium]